MPAFLTWLPAVFKIIVMIYKFIKDLKASGQDVESCLVAVKEAKETGDTEKLKAILVKARQGGCK